MNFRTTLLHIRTALRAVLASARQNLPSATWSTLIGVIVTAVLHVAGWH